jgi:hypothetical protein
VRGGEIVRRKSLIGCMSAIKIWVQGKKEEGRAKEIPRFWLVRLVSRSPFTETGDNDSVQRRNWVEFQMFVRDLFVVHYISFCVLTCTQYLLFPPFIYSLIKHFLRMPHVQNSDLDL